MPSPFQCLLQLSGVDVSSSLLLILPGKQRSGLVAWIPVHEASGNLTRPIISGV